MSNPQLRFSGIIPLDKLSEQKVCIIGAGGIGAPAALSLAKSGIKRLTLYDFDTIEDENLGPQIYGPNDLGKSKVNTLKDYISNFAPWCEVRAINQRFEDQKIDCDILISAVDSLEVRKTVWNTVEEGINGPKLLIDPRMAAEMLTIYSVVPKDDGLWYEDTLEGEAVEATCTTKATFYTGFVAGALCMQAVKAWLCDQRRQVEFNFDMVNLISYGRTKEEIYAEA